MHLGINDAGQDMQALAVNNVDRIAADIAQRHDPSVAHSNIGQAFAILVDHGGVLENHVVLRHVLGPACQCLGPV